VTWARLIQHSGGPIIFTACMPATATASAPEAATPISSEAEMTSRRATNSGDSPPASMRASQYSAPSASEPRIDLMNAEMIA
jgi:hypothetical protein